MRSFEDREGYVMAWDQACRIVFLPLDRLAPGSVPDAPVSGIDAVGGDAVGIDAVGGDAIGIVGGGDVG